MRVLAFAASLRRGSLNQKLILLAAEAARAAGAEVDLAEFREFDMPIYDGDVDASTGLPPGAAALRHRVEQADALMISAPEYNFSIAGPLKNAIDWVSRARPMPWRGRSVFLLSASPSAMAGSAGSGRRASRSRAAARWCSRTCSPCPTPARRSIRRES